MKKQSFFLVALVFSAFSLDLAATSSKKNFLQQLLTARPYKDDLRLNIANLAEVNISQLGHFAFIGTVISSIAFSKKALDNSNTYQKAFDAKVDGAPKTALAIFLLSISVFSSIIYRTLNAERIIPIRFDCDNDEAKINEETIS